MNARKNAAPWIGSVVPKRMNLNDIRNALATDAGSYGGVIYSRAVILELKIMILCAPANCRHSRQWSNLRRKAAVSGFFARRKSSPAAFLSFFGR